MGTQSIRRAPANSSVWAEPPTSAPVTSKAPPARVGTQEIATCRRSPGSPVAATA
jgi:hypothetical protein